MLTKYNTVIRTLMNNDRNATWDEILAEVDGDIKRASTELFEALETAIEEAEDEELKAFYKEQYMKVNEMLKSLKK